MSKDHLPTTHESLAADAVWGVADIAAEIGRSKQQVYYLISKGRIPVSRLGHRIIVASRRQLRRLIETTT